MSQHPVSVPRKSDSSREIMTPGADIIHVERFRGFLPRGIEHRREEIVQQQALFLKGDIMGFSGAT